VIVPRSDEICCSPRNLPIVIGFMYRVPTRLALAACRAELDSVMLELRQIILVLVEKLIGHLAYLGEGEN